MRKSRTPKFQYDCAVIGGGPGGLVSALYLGRFKRKVVLIDSGHSRAQWIPRIRNLIGYVKGLSGPLLLQKLEKQVRQYPIEWVQGEAEVFHSGAGFRVRVQERSFTARTVILATGMRDHQPPVGNVPALRKKNVLAYCPICDGYDQAGKRVGLLVKDNHGLKKMKYLSQYSSHIIAIQVRPFVVSPVHLKEIRRHRGFELHQGGIESLQYRSRPRGLIVQMKGAKEPVEVDIAYVGLGVEFNQKATKHLRKLRKTKDGHIITSSHQETSVAGLYAVGDCVNALAQVSVAVGQAALAATRIHNRLGIL